MCGIICVFSQDKANNIQNNYDSFKNVVARRGPDSFASTKVNLECGYNILLGASVLWLQGKRITEQPLENNQLVFIYNGDIFGGISEISKDENGDTSELLHLITNTENISSTLSEIQGPYSFIYLNKLSNTLYFGRDIYGRRSLLIGKSKTGAIILTSVAKRTNSHDFIELPSVGIFCWNLKNNELFVLPWQYRNKNFDIKLNEVKKFLSKDLYIKQLINLKDNKIFSTPIKEELILFEKLIQSSEHESFELLFNTSYWSSNISTLKRLLKEAVRKRISTAPKYCMNCMRSRVHCIHAHIGILFSGGVDCSLLAVMADFWVDEDKPIDLINVAFDESNDYKTPDRITALLSLEELQRICPKRKWRFLGINITKKELDEERQNCIADLIYPLTTVLDDSLGCALWFASKAKTDTLSSLCRVLLVGMGADELFGGYTKHRTAFKKHSWLGLHDILNEDWQNLSYRNLGRDDRVVSDHGRQLRTPYLDENVVEFVRNLNCWEKTIPSDNLPQGFGDKLLLRSMAYSVGFRKVATFKKRALQFGSRIANKRENANDISKKLCI